MRGLMMRQHNIIRPATRRGIQNLSFLNATENGSGTVSSHRSLFDRKDSHAPRNGQLSRATQAGDLEEQLIPGEFGVASH